jgi:hypothetical protein
MSIGEEDMRGNDVTKEAFKLLKASGLNFRGNIEEHDLFERPAEVVVCDGFSEFGNRRDGRWLDGSRLFGLLLYNRYSRLYRDRSRLYRIGKSRKDRRSKFFGSEGCVLHFGRFNDGYITFLIRAFSINFHTFLGTAASLDVQTGLCSWKLNLIAVQQVKSC